MGSMVGVVCYFLWVGDVLWLVGGVIGMIGCCMCSWCCEWC